MMENSFSKKPETQKNEIRDRKVVEMASEQNLETEDFFTEKIRKANSALRKTLLVGSLAVALSGENYFDKKEEAKETTKENQALKELHYSEKGLTPEIQKSIEHCFHSIWNANSIESYEMFYNNSIPEELYRPEILETVSWVGARFHIPPQDFNFLLKGGYFDDISHEGNREVIEKVFSILRAHGHEKPSLRYLPRYVDSFSEDATEEYFQNLEKISDLKIDFGRDGYLNEYTVSSFEFPQTLLDKIKENNVVVDIGFLNHYKDNDAMEAHEHIFNQVLSQGYISRFDPDAFFESNMISSKDQSSLFISSQELNDFLSTQEGKDLFNYFKSLGYDVGHIHAFLLKDVDWFQVPDYKILKKPTFKKVLETLSEQYSFGRRRMTEDIDFIERIKLFFDFSNDNDLEELTKILGDIENYTNVDQTISIFEKESSAGKMSQDIIGKDSEPRYELFLKDPAIDLIKKFSYDKNPPAFLDNFDVEEKAEMIMAVARSLMVYSPVESISEDDFEKKFKAIIEAKTNKEFLKQDLFKNKNVLVMANSEIIPQRERYGQESDSIRFFNPKTEKDMRLQGVKSLEVFRQNENNSAEDFFGKISNAKDLCLIFSGHGLPSAVYLNDTLTIGPEIIASALIKRFENKIYDTPILILGACHSHEIAIRIYDDILQYNRENEKEMGLPIVISEAEYGQYGYSDYESKYNDDMMEFLVNPKLRKVTKMKDVLTLEKLKGDKISSNISVFIPEVYQPKKTKEEQRKAYLQIADNLEDKNEKDFAEFLATNDDTSTTNYFEALNPQRAEEIRNMVYENKEDANQNMA